MDSGVCKASEYANYCCNTMHLHKSFKLIIYCYIFRKTVVIIHVSCPTPTTGPRLFSLYSKVIKSKIYLPLFALQKGYDCYNNMCTFSRALVWAETRDAGKLWDSQLQPKQRRSVTGSLVICQLESEVIIVWLHQSEVIGLLLCKDLMTSFWV